MNAEAGPSSGSACAAQRPCSPKTCPDTPRVPPVTVSPRPLILSHKTPSYINVCYMWPFGTVLKGTSAVLWRFPGTSACHQRPSHILSLPGLEPAALCFLAQSPTDWRQILNNMHHSNRAVLHRPPSSFATRCNELWTSLRQIYWLIPQLSVFLTLSSSPSLTNPFLVWITHYIHSDTFPECLINWDTFGFWFCSGCSNFISALP